MRKTSLLFSSLILVGTCAATLHRCADTFGSGANTFNIDFVTIGNPGNPPDENPNPAGAVPYEFRIGKYEISEQMIDKANLLGGLGITKDSRGPDYPATSVTWFEAAKFVNWLNSDSSGTPAYKFDANGVFQLWTPGDPGYNAANLYRNSLAKYFLPSVNEWHKAAYYDPLAGHYWDYPTGSDAIPDGIDFVGDPTFDAVFYDGGLNSSPNDVVNVGLVSPLGTAGQGGNIAEWVETAFDRINSSPNEQRGRLGGSWTDGSTLLAAWNSGIGVGPQFEDNFYGIRFGSVVPEPNILLLAATAYIFVMLCSLARRPRA